MLRIQKYDPTTLKQEWSTAFVLLHFSPNRKKILFFLKDDTTATSLNTMNAQLTTTGSNPLLDPVPGNRIKADPPQSLEDATKWAPSVDSTIKKYFWNLSSHCSFDHIKYLLIPAFFRVSFCHTFVHLEIHHMLTGSLNRTQESLASLPWQHCSCFADSYWQRQVCQLCTKFIRIPSHCQVTTNEYIFIVKNNLWVGRKLALYFYSKSLHPGIAVKI